jgi:hypothetical protein
VLKEEDERRGLEEGDIGAEELRSAMLGRAVGWRLDRISSSDRHGAGHLGDGGCRSSCDGSCCSGILAIGRVEGVMLDGLGAF